MNKIEGVILDWAGTTVDYGCFAPVGAFMKVFEHKGIAVTEAETRIPMGVLKRDHIKAMLSMDRIGALWKKTFGHAYTEKDIDALYADFEPMLIASLENYSSPKPKVLETIDKLRDRGIKIGSTTGYTKSMMDIVVAAAQKRGYAPDCWVTPDATGSKGRPYPYMIFRNMEALRLGNVRHIIKVGDTIADICEGKNAGAWSVGIIEGSSMMGLTEDGYQALDEAKKQQYIKRVTDSYINAGADFVINDISGIFGIIAEIEKTINSQK